jgi:hypothetical protein
MSETTPFFLVRLSISHATLHSNANMATKMKKKPSGRRNRGGASRPKQPHLALSPRPTLVAKSTEPEAKDKAGDEASKRFNAAFAAVSQYYKRCDVEGVDVLAQPNKIADLWERFCGDQKIRGVRTSLIHLVEISNPDKLLCRVKDLPAPLHVKYVKDALVALAATRNDLDKVACLAVELCKLCDLDEACTAEIKEGALDTYAVETLHMDTQFAMAPYADPPRDALAYSQYLGR